MSKDKIWKGFDQLLVSPLIGHRRPSRRQQRLRLNKNNSLTHMRDHDDGWQIEDHSDEDTTCSGRHESESLSSTITPSVPQSLNPAEITINRRNQSDSEIEQLSEDGCRPQYETTSESSDSDDCLAIHCTKSRMTKIQFVDNNPMKRRRITDDMDVSFVAGTCRAKNRPFKDATSPKQFKSIYVPNHNTTSIGLNSSVVSTTDNRSTRCWKSFDASFTEQQEASVIEELSSSPESSRTEPLNIEELPPSADESSYINRSSLPASSTTSPSKSFYVTTPGTKSKNKPHPKSSPLGALEMILQDRSSRQHLWQHAITSGTVQPDLVIKLDSIERIFGRVMLRFFTTTTEADDCVQEQIENMIFLDQGDKQLKSIHAGMNLALEVDERIMPHRVSHNKLVHLGVTKLCPLPITTK